MSPALAFPSLQAGVHYCGASLGSENRGATASATAGALRRSGGWRGAPPTVIPRLLRSLMYSGSSLPGGWGGGGGRGVGAQQPHSALAQEELCPHCTPSTLLAAMTAGPPKHAGRQHGRPQRRSRMPTQATSQGSNGNRTPAPASPLTMCPPACRAGPPRCECCSAAGWPSGWRLQGGGFPVGGSRRSQTAMHASRPDNQVRRT